MNAMKQVIAKLETELHEKSTNNSFLEAEIRTMQRKLQMKDAEINRQSTELHKLRVTKFFHKHWGKRIFMSFFRNSRFFSSCSKKDEWENDAFWRKSWEMARSYLWGWLAQGRDSISWSHDYWQLNVTKGQWRGSHKKRLRTKWNLFSCKLT